MTQAQSFRAALITELERRDVASLERLAAQLERRGGHKAAKIIRGIALRGGNHGSKH